MCCVCRQDICCVCSQDICCVSRQEICSLPRHPLGIARTGAAAVWAMKKECLGRQQISCLLTQQMSWLQTQQMSSLQTQHMSCLQAIQASYGKIRKAATQILGFGREKSGIFPWEAGFCYETLRYYAALDIVRFCGPGYGYPWAWWL